MNLLNKSRPLPTTIVTEIIKKLIRGKIFPGNVPVKNNRMDCWGIIIR